MSEVRLITPITRQSTKKMQVAAYCRVSSNSADQLNSYAAQIRAYKKLIGERDDWELVDIFADEGLTGMKSETRDEFQRMIRMCELKQIDLIITKSISRFARNTKDALAYVRKLKLLGVGVQFEKEGISTLSMGDEMLLNTFSALAQEESQSISMNQRLSIVKRMELGEYVDSNAPYGYRLVDKMLAVYEPEAVIVRNIFTLYLQGFSTSEIARELNKLNIPTKSGKETWRPSRVAFALRSEVAAFQNDESDNILDFVSVDEYRKMEDELKKAYQYFEWNDRSGAYRYYEEIQKKVAAQVKDWKAINPRAEITSVRIMLFST